MESSDCVATGCKEVERIGTLVEEAKKELYDLCERFRDIVDERIFSQGNLKGGDNTPAEPESANKFDRIMTDIHRIINTAREFKKGDLERLDKELSKL